MNNFAVLNMYLKFTEHEDEELSGLQIDEKISINIAAYESEFMEKSILKDVANHYCFAMFYSLDII